MCVCICWLGLNKPKWYTNFDRFTCHTQWSTGRKSPKCLLASLKPHPVILKEKKKPHEYIPEARLNHYNLKCGDFLFFHVERIIKKCAWSNTKNGKVQGSENSSKSCNYQRHQTKPGETYLNLVLEQNLYEPNLES